MGREGQAGVSRTLRAHSSANTLIARQSNLSGRNPSAPEIAIWIARGGPLGGSVTSTQRSWPGLRGRGERARSGMKSIVSVLNVARLQCVLGRKVRVSVFRGAPEISVRFGTSLPLTALSDTCH